MLISFSERLRKVLFLFLFLFLSLLFLFLSLFPLLPFLFLFLFLSTKLLLKHQCPLEPRLRLEKLHWPKSPLQFRWEVLRLLDVLVRRRLAITHGHRGDLICQERMNAKPDELIR
eukprot:s1650_g10.t1